jgi:ribosomal protein S18 acetylase RimI-like enzyme
MTMGSAMEPRITIRRVEESDKVGLASALAPGVSMEQIIHRWQDYCEGYRDMLVAVLDGDVVGTVSTTGHRFQMPDSLRMFTLDVGPAFRCQGVGTALIKAVEEKARCDGLGRVNLEVALGNAGALRLYGRLGYSSLGKPVVDCWEQLTDGGSCKQVEEYSWVMVKNLRTPSES